MKFIPVLFFIQFGKQLTNCVAAAAVGDDIVGNDVVGDDNVDVSSDVSIDVGGDDVVEGTAGRSVVGMDVVTARALVGHVLRAATKAFASEVNNVLINKPAVVLTTAAQPSACLRPSSPTVGPGDTVRTPSVLAKHVNIGDCDVSSIIGDQVTEGSTSLDSSDVDGCVVSDNVLAADVGDAGINDDAAPGDVGDVSRCW